MSPDDVFVITGGAGGMGLAIARALASQGQLLLLDVGEKELERAGKTLASMGARVETLRCDVTSVEETERVADKVRAMGSFRSLVHTAGISPEMADARRVLEVDLQGSVRMTDAVFPLVGPGSSAILIGSIAGYSDVDPAVESLLDDPMAEGFVDEV